MTSSGPAHVGKYPRDRPDTDQLADAECQADPADRFAPASLACSQRWTQRGKDRRRCRRYPANVARYHLPGMSRCAGNSALLTAW